MLAEPHTLDRYEAKLRRELGPAVLAALADTKTEDILLNPDGKLWVNRTGEGFIRIGEMGASVAQSAIGTIAAWHGMIVNAASPILETELPLGSARFEGLLPPLVSAPSFAIRVLPRTVRTLEDYERSGILTARDKHHVRSAPSGFAQTLAGCSHSEVIRRAILARRNILVVGSTGSGKTTLVNVILQAMATVCPRDRLVIIEDTAELSSPSENQIKLHSTEGISMLRCLRVCMRLKPQRIVVGEVRGREALTLLKAWNTGHSGGIATIHAEACDSGLLRLEALVFEDPDARDSLIRSLICESVHLVVFIDPEPSLPAGRKVREVAVVNGYDANSGRYQLQYV